MKFRGRGGMVKAHATCKKSIYPSGDPDVPLDPLINVGQIIIIANGINSQTPKLETALARVRDELERNQKK